MTVVISSGHGKLIRGANGHIDEVDEARRVVARLGKILGCRTFDDNTSKSQGQNLDTIVAWHNKQSRTLDVSVHFNAFQPTDKPMGTEVCYKTQSSLAKTVSGAIAKAGGFIDRGAKKRDGLAFLSKTNRPAILLEICFVDSKADTTLYKLNFDKICNAIAEALQ